MCSMFALHLDGNFDEWDVINHNINLLTSRPLALFSFFLKSSSGKTGEYDLQNCQKPEKHNKYNFHRSHSEIISIIPSASHQ